MLRRALSLLFYILLAAGFVWFSVANRHAVTLSFSPLPYTLEIPLFLLLTLCLMLGMLLCWLGMCAGLWRLSRISKREHARVMALENEIAGLKAEKTP